MNPPARLCSLLALSIAATPLYAGAARHIASYELIARLDPKAKAVEGSQILTWRNDSPDEIRELRFHLYMNAFKNEKSTFMRESGGLSRGHARSEHGWGWIDVKKLRIANGADLMKSIRFIQPDDGNADDRTVIAVVLPVPVKPGGSIRLAMDFYTKLPKVFARTGYHDEFYLVAQWFPKIGVWQNGGWNCQQFHALSEFFADFGTYTATVTVPSNYVVGATGVLENRRENAAARTTTYRFAEQDVHDFAWTASPAYVRVERTFEADREVTPRELAENARLLGLPESEVRLRDVKMILLIQPEHRAQIDRHFRALGDGLKYFGLWYGAYPYRTITLVDPPFHAAGAGGMEYPTLITAGTSWLIDAGGFGPEGVIVHEFGHQYWYGMVANNEFEEAWLDEGITSYSSSRLLDRARGELRLPVYVLGIPVGRWLGTPTARWSIDNRLSYLLSPETDRVPRRAWEFYDSLSYAVNSYTRPALALRLLENHLGSTLMSRVMRTYFQRWKYRHPTTRDFIQVVNEVSGRDMNWFFDQFLFGSNALDYGIGEVNCRKDGAQSGVYDLPSGRVTLSAEEAGRRGKKQPERYECEVKIRREGEAVYPVRVRVRFEDGETLDRHWDGQYRWTKLHFSRPSRIDWVTVDPGYDVPLDASYANNSRTGRAQTAPLFKWAENLLFWAQNVLLAVSALS